jgi:hypothetical protein
MVMNEVLATPLYPWQLPVRRTWQPSIGSDPATAYSGARLLWRSQRLPPSLTHPDVHQAFRRHCSGAADGFVAYRPHDEAITAGLSGLDIQDLQAVIDIRNK